MASTGIEAEKKQLYSRQEYVVGAEAQAKYGATSVLVVGASGLGAEIIKNLVLTGVKAVKVLDGTPAQLSDLSTNFFLRAEDVGKPRGPLVAQAAKELNRFVDVSAVAVANGSAAAEDAAVLATLPSVQVVVYTNHPTARLTAANKAARAHDVKFISCESRGIAGCVFVDAGSTFEVADTNGEDTVTCVVTGISRDGLVTLHDDKAHECEPGSSVFFTGVVSPAALNSQDPASPSTASAPAAPLRLFEVADVSNPYILRVKGMEALLPGAQDAVDVGTTAYMHTTKRRQTMHFKSLEESLASPELVTVFDSEAKQHAGPSLHAIFSAWAAADRQVLQQPGGLQAVAAEAKALCSDVDESFALQVLALFDGDLNPMACFVGGLAAQEALKVCSGKFTPIHQWLYYDVRELLATRTGTPAEWLSEATAALAAASGAAAGSTAAAKAEHHTGRYAGQVAVLGEPFQRYLRYQTAFVVGAGALGCELLKNIALMGLGALSVTDMDQIEMSNLSRQFLFRSHHIGRAKSTVAAEASKAINPTLCITSYEEKMAPETEGVFNEKFWSTHSVVVNALDNIASRKYVDSRCLFYQRPLFESGTLGTKCNTQVVIPYTTESYSNSSDPPEKSIPLCTLKNFPNAIEHTIQWARDQFQLLFSGTPEDVNRYLSDPAAFAASLERDPAGATLVLKHVNDALRGWPSDEADCVRTARLLFHEFFNESFRQLLHNIPLDRRNEDGQLFWSGAKKPPTPQVFSVDNPRDVAFVYHTAALLAHVYGLPPMTMTLEQVAAAAAAVPAPDFVPKHAVFATSQNDKEEKASAQLVGELTARDLPPATAFAGKRMRVVDFEKDNATNHHIDFITYCSNSRAEAYGIPPADLVQTKRIAGQIIPAMVTTTALVTGLVGFEILKYLLVTFTHHQRHNALAPASPVAPNTDKEIAQLLSYYRNAFVNIALPLLAFSDPFAAPGRTYTRPEGKGTLRWGAWDRLDVNEGRDVSVNALVALLEERYSLEVFMLALTSGKIVYSQFGGKAKDKEKPVSVLCVEKGEPQQDGEDFLSIVATGAIGDDEEVDVPMIRYKYRNF